MFTTVSLNQTVEVVAGHFMACNGGGLPIPRLHSIKPYLGES
jgi:hypothetical protein